MRCSRRAAGTIPGPTGGTVPSGGRSKPCHREQGEHCGPARAHRSLCVLLGSAPRRATGSGGGRALWPGESLGAPVLCVCRRLPAAVPGGHRLHGQQRGLPPAQQPALPEPGAHLLRRWAGGQRAWAAKLQGSAALTRRRQGKGPGRRACHERSVTAIRKGRVKMAAGAICSWLMKQCAVCAEAIKAVGQVISHYDSDQK